MRDIKPGHSGDEAHGVVLGGADQQTGLSAAARRALVEAAERRAKSEKGAEAEIGGRGGLDPARYGDWEVKGLASDF